MKTNILVLIFDESYNSSAGAQVNLITVLKMIIIYI